MPDIELKFPYIIYANPRSVNIGFYYFYFSTWRGFLDFLCFLYHYLFLFRFSHWDEEYSHTRQTVKLNLLSWWWSSGWRPRTTCHRDFRPSKNAQMLSWGAVAVTNPPMEQSFLCAKQGIYTSVTHHQPRAQTHRLRDSEFTGQGWDSGLHSFTRFAHAQL